MGRFDELMREIGDWDPARSDKDNHDRAVIASVRKKLTKPGPLAKSLPAFNAGVKRMKAAQRDQAKALGHTDRDAKRREFDRLNAECTALAKSGDISGEQGALLDVHLGNLARVWGL